MPSFFLACAQVIFIWNWVFEALITLSYATIPSLRTSADAIFLWIAAIEVAFDAPVAFWAALVPTIATIFARATFVLWPDVDLGSTTPVVFEALKVSSAMGFLFIIVVLHVEEIFDIQSPDLTPVLRSSELDTFAICPIPALFFAVLQAGCSYDRDLALAFSVCVLFLGGIMAAHCMRTFADEIQADGSGDIDLCNILRLGQCDVLRLG